MNPPVFAHGHLRLYLLSLLDEQPRHGYELIQALAERFDGAYAPSAGTIYPRLAKLEEEGLVSKETSGRKTIYSITPAGREELERRRHELDEIDTNIEASVRRLADQVRVGLTTATAQLREELGPVARDFGESARRFAAETATQARQAWTQGVQAGTEASAAGQAGAAGAAGAAGVPRDTEPRAQDAPPEPADKQRPRPFSAAAQDGQPAAAGQRTDGETAAPAAQDAGPSAEARQAEIALEHFRGEVRREVRDAERAGRFSPSVQRMLEDELDRVLAQLQQALGTRRPQ